MNQLRQDASFVVTTQSRMVDKDYVRKEETNDYLHAPNICDDSYLIEVGPTPFEHDTTNITQVSDMFKEIFEDAYSIPYEIVKDLRMYFPTDAQPSD